MILIDLIKSVISGKNIREAKREYDKENRMNEEAAKNAIDAVGVFAPLGTGTAINTIRDVGVPSVIAISSDEIRDKIVNDPAYAGLTPIEAKRKLEAEKKAQDAKEQKQQEQNNSSNSSEYSSSDASNAAESSKPKKESSNGEQDSNQPFDWEKFKDFLGELADKLRDLFPELNDGWYDDGHQCLAPWAKDVNRDGKYRIVDPLALDLDNDGIETIAVAGFSGSLFDYNNDGIRTATGWVSADDGLLVRDLNGNGIIDNGSELFGDNTTLADGSKAAHGFAALAELDSNSDGKVDALDKAFNELKVWVDADSDGVSQASELHTLDAWFAADKLYSRFIDKIDMTAEQAQAANDERYVQAA